MRDRNRRILVRAVASCVFLAVCIHAVGEVHCDLLVHLVDPNGRSTSGAARAISKSGEVLAQGESKNGIVSLCDIGLVAFDLVIQNAFCGELIIPDYEIPSFPVEDKLTVTLNPCPHQMANVGCRVLLRVRDESDRPIKGARLSIGRSEYRRPSDERGRLWFSAGFDQDLEVRIDAPGYERATETVTCQRSNVRLEKSITLTESTR